MDSAGIFRFGSRLPIFLREFETLFPFTNLWIPGPLVSAFKNLSCFWPSATGQFGNVSPSLLATPEWTQANRFSFGNRFASHLPNISIFISRLHSICSIATRPAVTEHLFCNDVDGPRFMATLFSQACVHDENELINVASPGASLTYAGGLRLWQNAAANLSFYDLPSPLDISVDHVENDWISALTMNNSSSWLGPLAAMMAKYCQFWKGSCSLADCSPDGSATGSVRCVATGGTNVFQGPVWTNETGSHNNFQHGNANQVGHSPCAPIYTSCLMPPPPSTIFQMLMSILL
ncbi:hypothetical protein MTR67_024001 [Solanum verrucosum]|uniref:Uncharacterized protein n=1 Tax=Solanum verrucosum TaxID=315347 RepID=A0AAF0QW86_SOLVR|nr:hypothetical protein MTR67_024001 [Solanum verrucosum]